MGPALRGATGSAGLGGSSGDEPGQPPRAGHGHLQPARPGGVGALQRRSHSRRGFAELRRQQAEPGSRGEAGLSSGDKQGSLVQRRCPSGTAERGHAQPTQLRDSRNPALLLVSIRAPGCGPQALPAFTLIEEVAELKERFICSPLAEQRFAALRLQPSPLFFF